MASFLGRNTPGHFAVPPSSDGDDNFHDPQPSASQDLPEFDSLFRSSARLPALPFYGGEKTPKVLIGWIDSVELRIELLDIPEKLRVLFAASYLKDEAATWFRNLRLSEGLPTSWDTYIQSMKLRFLPPDYYENLHARWFRLKQMRGVGEYIEQFQNLTRELGPTYVLTNMAVKHFIANLKPATRQAVEMKLADTPNPTLESTYHYALIADRSYQVSHRWSPSYARNPTPAPVATAPHDDGGYRPMDLSALQTRPFKKLTDEEKTYLIKNHGCFKCRKLGHMANQCPERTQQKNEQRQ